MKKIVYLPLLCACFTLSFFPCGCKSAKRRKNVAPPAYYSQLESPTVGEDFEVSPLPPKRSANNGYWDVSDVDISAVDATKKLICFSFDDAPASTLESILSVFAG